jgi:hypothetical protein
MLDRCGAFLVARTEGQTGTLEKIARHLGFGTLIPINSRRDFAASETPHPVDFFLIHHHLNDSLVSAVLRAVRASQHERIRFAPIVMFIEDCPFETYLRYVHMGFDDVLALPDKRDILVQRMEGQLLSPHTYFRTGAYFGPDRRRMDLSGTIDERRGTGKHWHDEIRFMRDPNAGISIVDQRSVFEHDGHRHET